MFDQRVICPRATLTREETLGLCVRAGIRSNWFRSLPLSALEGLRLRLDGVPIDAAGVAVLLDERPWPLDALAEMADREWFVTDPLPVLFAVARPVRGRHRLGVSYGMRIPDLVFAGRALVETVDAEAEIVVS